MDGFIAFFSHTLDNANPLFLGVVLIATAGWVFAPVYALTSDRCTGIAKCFWVLVTLCFAWLGLAVFLIATCRHPAVKRRHVTG